MQKPHDYPLRIRFWHFLRGLLFYNTVYWKRASDELKPPRLSREERASLQPAPDPEIIRPRERPRPNPAPEVATPPPAIPPFAMGAMPAAQPQGNRADGDPATLPVLSMPGEVAAASLPEAVEPETMIKRRRYKRRRSKVRASRSTGLLAMTNAKEGFFARLLKRMSAD